MISQNIEVRDSDLHGKGIFSKTSFALGQTITIITGEIINGDECVRREDEEDNVYIFYKDEDEYIDVSKHQELKYLNHSCDYNCDIDEDENGNLVLFADSEIEPGEELTIDYGYDEIYDSCSCLDCDNKIQTDSENLLIEQVQVNI